MSGKFIMLVHPVCPNHPRRGLFSCQHCDAPICAECHAIVDVPVGADVEIMTIGSHYCGQAECVAAEADAIGWTVEKTRAWRIERGWATA